MVSILINKDGVKVKTPRKCTDKLTNDAYLAKAVKRAKLIGKLKEKSQKHVSIESDWD